MDPVPEPMKDMANVKLTPQYHLYVMNPVLYLLDIGYVWRVVFLVLIGMAFMKNAIILVSKFYINVTLYFKVIRCFHYLKVIPQCMNILYVSIDLTKVNFLRWLK